MSGARLIGVGVGPGDPELITLKALRALGEADVIAHFAKAGNASHSRTIAAQHLRAEVVELPMLYPVTTELPKCSAGYRDAISGFYNGAAAEIAAHLEDGRVVAVICEGDPLFYGSYMHLHARLAPRFATEIVAGVTGMSGCWSAAGMPIAQGDDVFTVLPATLPEDELARRLADTDAAVVMKVGRHLPKLRRALSCSGKLARAIYVERGTMADAKMHPARRQAGRRGSVLCRGAGAGLGGAAMTGRLAVVGLGPGDPRYLTPEADEALCAAEALYGYVAYLDRVPARAGQSRYPSDNREERARAGAALRHAAQGASVAVVSGGDPGVFAMAAAVCEAIEAGPEAWRALDVVIIPGITAMLAVAASIGAPLGHDFCALSLSDNLKPWQLIERRLDAAASAGFVIALYNPVSRASVAVRQRDRAAAPSSAAIDAGGVRPRRRAAGRARERHHARRRRCGEGRYGNAGDRRLARNARRGARRAFASGLHAACRRGGQRMIEPGNRVLCSLDRRTVGRGRPAQQHDVDAESARRGNLAVGRGTAAVLCDHYIDVVRVHECALVGFFERAAGGHVGRMRQRQARIDRIDAADEIMVLRRRGERREFVTPERNEDAASRFPQRLHRVGHASRLDPSIPRNRDPRRPADRHTRHFGLSRRLYGVCCDDSSVRMRCVDQRADVFSHEIVRKPRGAAEPADANRHRLRRGRCSSAGERKRDVKPGAPGQAAGQDPRFRGAAENKDAWHAAP